VVARRRLGGGASWHWPDASLPDERPVISTAEVDKSLS